MKQGIASPAGKRRRPGLDGDVTGLIATGDELALDPAAGTVTILARAAGG
ncbi:MULTISPECIES: hypothetical protein [Methylorubrum]|nr:MULTISPECIES: hypothetical protein [Methylorubrum]MCP1547216.1 hypothetical protein [Methylorubrum zatmanii]MCP1556168.1 hypothetical protein [Methylorubrum extorquens]MCP1577519.1 hypothetical protein [Methylorubrum extorquens]